VNESFMAWLSLQQQPTPAQALPKPADGDTEGVNESFMAWLSPQVPPKPAEARRSQPKATQRG